MRSIVKIAALSVAAGSFLFAGGDTIVEPEVIPAQVVEEIKSSIEIHPYVGVGYGYFRQQANEISSENGTDGEWTVGTGMLQAGVNLHKYFAVEARYWLGFEDLKQDLHGTENDLPGEYYAWGIYAKAMYPVVENVNVYGLVGYAETSLEADNGFYWDTESVSFGAGASYQFSENLSIFADYVVLGIQDEFDLHSASGVSVESANDIYIDTVNVGVTYTF